MHLKYISSTDINQEQIIESIVVFVLPFTDITQAKQVSTLLSERAGYKGTILCVHDTHRDGFIQIANTVFRASNCKYFGYLAQDIFPCRDWLRIAMKSISGNNFGLLGFNDGKWHGKIASFGMVDTLWAKKNYKGDLFCPDYEQHYADTELTLIAKADGVYCYEPNSVLMEIDWNKDKKLTNKNDLDCFNTRYLSGFNSRINIKHYP